MVVVVICGVVFLGVSCIVLKMKLDKANEALGYRGATLSLYKYYIECQEEEILQLKTKNNDLQKQLDEYLDKEVEELLNKGSRA